MGRTRGELLRKREASEAPSRGQGHIAALPVLLFEVFLRVLRGLRGERLSSFPDVQWLRLVSSVLIPICCPPGPRLLCPWMVLSGMLGAFVEETMPIGSRCGPRGREMTWRPNR